MAKFFQTSVNPLGDVAVECNNCESDVKHRKVRFPKEDEKQVDVVGIGSIEKLVAEDDVE